MKKRVCFHLGNVYVAKQALQWCCYTALFRAAHYYRVFLIDEVCLPAWLGLQLSSRNIKHLLCIREGIYDPSTITWIFFVYYSILVH